MRKRRGGGAYSGHYDSEGQIAVKETEISFGPARLTAFGRV